MNATMPPQHERCAWAIAHSRKLRNAFDRGLIKPDEYARSFADCAVTACDECMCDLVDNLPDPLIISLSDGLKQFLEPVNFMPHPGPFIPGAASQEEIDQTSRHLRPKYIRIYDLIMNRVDAMTGQVVGGGKGEACRF